MAPYLCLKHAAAAFSPTNHALLFGQLECLLAVAQVEVHRELFAIHPGHCSWPRCLLEQTGGWAAAGPLTSPADPCSVRSLSATAGCNFPRILHLAGFACISLPLWDPTSVTEIQGGIERERRRGGEKGRGERGERRRREMLHLLA